ncbi:hypothetical protein H6G33_36415 [Calothrix sp. FACHB-1219]|uniref:hypothetical protein n=1 Tax=unclassified Calothrix TaxID=2619626 RepID=UPI00168516E7|nr:MULTISPECIES: hypothetical protein [unclassified Calothrix]MBD2207797.1 hypothetical protein [Calothrix sp. FACHB-168]MBD2222417.1 hypothetical protein [Calothrix sp. FACHB-1219]
MGVGPSPGVLGFDSQAWELRIGQWHCWDIAVAVLPPGKLGVKLKSAIAPLEVPAHSIWRRRIGDWCWGVEAIALMSAGIF